MKPARDARSPLPPPVRPARPSAGRLAGRVLTLCVALAVALLIVVQYRGIIARNVALAAELQRTRDDVAALRVRTARETRALQRLQSPSGAVPEIHDKLRMVGDNEELIVLKGDVPPTAAPVLRPAQSDETP